MIDEDEFRVKVKVEGVNYMNDDPSAVDVLFAETSSDSNR